MRIEVPGLFDLQVNGFGGIDFNSAGLTADRVDEALQQVLATGVTRCLPTLITSSFEQFAASARVLSRMACAAVAGIHMEGPYLSPADGAPGRPRSRPHDRPCSTRGRSAPDDHRTAPRTPPPTRSGHPPDNP